MADITEQNSQFWNELCGSQLATTLGIVDNKPASLKKFDDWYFDFYPYLNKHVDFTNLKNKNVLEVGLGYGSVAQKIAEAGANYQGLDIASGPVHMVNHRLGQANLPGEAKQGSILTPPFTNGSFDAIIAIGCLHHTGNLALAIKNCFNMLKPGGKLVFMVYNAYSYRRFMGTTGVTLKYLLREIFGYRGVVGNSNKHERAAYDINSTGIAAPHTDFISVRSLKQLCSQFSSYQATLENIDQEKPFTKKTRTQLMSTCWPKYLGLDIYVQAIK